MNKTFGESSINPLKEPFLLLNMKIDGMSLTMTPSFPLPLITAFHSLAFTLETELLEEEGLSI